MGKKSKGDFNADFQRGLISGTDSKINKLLERYGVEGHRYGGRGIEMTGQSYRSAEMVQKDLSKAMASDYDTRRSLEAAALSGNKKAKKLIDNGFDSVKGIYKTQKFFDKAADKQGYKSFDSPNDYMSLTQHFVNQDRKAQTADYENKFASKSDLDDLKKVKSVDEQVEEAQYVPSDKVKAAKERVAGYKDGVSTDGDGDKQRAEAADSFAKYKLNLDPYK